MPTRSVRLISLLIGLTLTWLGLSFSDPAWAQSIGIDIWNVDALIAQKEQSDLRLIELDQYGERAMARYSLNQLMVEELVASKRDLFDVADQMYQENIAYPGYSFIIERYPTQMPLNQRAVEHILRRARHILRGRADAHVVMNRFKCQYVQKFGTPPLSE